jgi:hypothetical protein
MGWLIHSYNVLISFLSNPIAYLLPIPFRANGLVATILERERQIRLSDMGTCSAAFLMLSEQV